MGFLGLFVFVCLLSYNGVSCKKSFKTKYGDIYDCVDFYKQPTFKIPAFKNHSFHHLMRPNFLAKSMEGNRLATKPDMKRESCPIGFVPIRRSTKGDSNEQSLVVVNEPSRTYSAGVRTISGSTRYAGGGMRLSIWNPPFVRPSAYSQARMKVSSGPDAIQAGWRVDPSLRGDNRTRLYIYTDAGQSHCFDAQCGFVIVSTQFHLGAVFENVSQAGGIRYATKYNITRDQSSGNWWLLFGRYGVEIGFWPNKIFTGLADLALEVEWAGEVYSPPGVEEPIMGSGYRPNIGSTKYVAYFAYMTVVTENYTSVDAGNLEEFATDRSLYDVKDRGNVGFDFNRLALYGGARY